MAYTEEKAFELVSSAFERGRLGHAFLITGDAVAGGERLVARMIDLVNGGDEVTSGLDLFGEAPAPEPKSLEELEGDLVRIVRPEMKSRRIGVDAIRGMEKSMYQSAVRDKWKVGVVLDADRMSVQAENAFLKTLEEPPNQCLLLLVTASPERLLPTILSRCVNLPLMTSEKRELYEGEKELVEVLSRVGREGFGSVARALTIRAQFSKILDGRKAAIAKLNDVAYKEEVLQYKQATDGEWLKQREKDFQAMTVSESLLERSRLIDVLIGWLGDVVRVKVGVSTLDYPGQEKVARGVAERESLEGLLGRMEALEELRGMLETNVSEQLALEVGFMRAFG